MSCGAPTSTLLVTVSHASQLLLLKTAKSSLFCATIIIIIVAVIIIEWQVGKRLLQIMSWYHENWIQTDNWFLGLATEQGKDWSTKCLSFKLVWARNKSLGSLKNYYKLIISSLTIMTSHEFSLNLTEDKNERPTGLTTLQFHSAVPDSDQESH